MRMRVLHLDVAAMRPATIFCQTRPPGAETGADTLRTGNMKKTLTLLFTFLTTSLYATIIPVDFGPPGVHHGGFEYDYIPTAGLDNTHLNGQNLSVDFGFGSHFIRAFTLTTNLGFSLGLTLDGGYLFPPGFPISQQLDLGSGYFTNAQGQRVGSATALFGYYGSGSFNRPGNALTSMQIYGSLALGLPRPLDLYGLHLDLTLPDIDAFITEDGNPNGWRRHNTTYVAIDARGPYPRNSIFGVGPNIPADIVRDNGSTFLLFTLACLCLTGFRPRR